MIVNALSQACQTLMSEDWCIEQKEVGLATTIFKVTGLALTRISHTLSVNLDNLSRHLRPQIPSPCRFDNVLRYLRTNLTQHLAQLHSI